MSGKSGMRKIILLSFFLLAFAVPCFAEPLSLDDETRALCNEIIRGIYADILAVKDKYKELANFDESVIYENQLGIYSIIYQFGSHDPQEKDPRKIPFAFGITIDGIEDETFKPQDGSFNYGFPLLRLKISGYRKKHLLRTQFDIVPLIQTYGKKLAYYEQKEMPLRMLLRPIKNSFKVKEDIEFEVEIKNVTKRHMLVHELNEKTLYFIVNGQEWGVNSEGQSYTSFDDGSTPPEDASKAQQFAQRTTYQGKLILRSGESLKLRFRGASFQKPQEIEIHGTYKMAIEGVYPIAQLKFQVVE
jgi:hypothetical protein